MIRRFLPRSLLLLAAIAFVSTACDYNDTAALPPSEIRNAPMPKPSAAADQASATSLRPATVSTSFDSPEQKEKREAILTNVLRLIETAGITPGGRHFEIATDNLNQYFEQGTKPNDFQVSAASRQYLLTMLNEKFLQEFESPKFTIRDARHLEDCMLYQEIATRVAGEGDDLTRVRRVFDWMVRQVQLVPAQSLAPASLQQAQARPFDVLLRGMATESQGYWSERGWLFMALCRQLGIDVGLITYTPPVAPKLLSPQPDAPSEPTTVAWICVALINDKAYLFDPRIGLAIPDASGAGVATLEEVLDDPQLLARLDLPKQSPYPTNAFDLLNSTTKIGVLIDSSSGYLSPRMRLLQSRLTGKNRTILFRDPADQRDHFASVLGRRFGNAQLWQMPLYVETSLFTNPQFVEATQQSLALFNGNLPLLYARIAQLKGNTPEAIQQYVAFRFATGGLMRDKKTPIVPQVQKALDIYATYFLAQCHLDQGNLKQAEFFYGETLRLVPAPGGGRPSFFMFRWGAQTNLGLLCESRGDLGRAVAFYSVYQPTYQMHGDLLRARDIVWRSPMADPPAPLPPPPGPTTPPNQTTMK